ncbi:MAG TPA: hypothetical protein VFW28_09390 [Micropepsaceae bacterium]|nr:hypothetical protein [Micropepsaceae bacterium]
MRKALISMLVSAAMLMGQMPVMAADTGPLTPGAAAGVQQAQGRDDYDNPPIIWIIGGLIVVGVGIWILTAGSSSVSLTQAAATTTGGGVGPQNH